MLARGILTDDCLVLLEISDVVELLRIAAESLHQEVTDSHHKRKHFRFERLFVPKHGTPHDVEVAPPATSSGET